MKPVLIIIDVQQAIDHHSWGRRNNSDAEQQMARLLERWRDLKLPIVHVQHISTEPNSTYRPNQPGCEFKKEVKPLLEEKVVQKSVNCAFIGTDLEEYLRTNGYEHLVITGVITNNSVEATARVAGNLGFNTTLVSDATATFDKQDLRGKWHVAEVVHELALANLSGEYATIQTTEQVLEFLEVKADVATS
ncbi:MAG: cysteine hydrolase family protein [Trueperaceae bacterium]